MKNYAFISHDERLIEAAQDTQKTTPRQTENTPRGFLGINTRTPWANLSIDTSVLPSGDSTYSVYANQTLSPPIVDATIESVSSSNILTCASAMRSGSSQLASTPPGVLPERYTTDLVQWQSPNDLPERRLMIQRILAITQSKALHTTAAAGTLTNITETDRDRTPSLAKRIELSLYSRAASITEYQDLTTLRRRLQSLVSLSYHEAAVSRRRCVTLSIRKDAEMMACLKRKRQSNVEMTVLMKRQRLLSRPNSPMYHTLQHEQFFLTTDEHIIRHVFSFLPGTDVIRCCRLNRFAARVLPTCVYSLDLDMRQLHAAFTIQSPAFLCTFPTLERLNIYNAEKPCDVDTIKDPNNLSLYAWGCSELEISHDNIGEEVVKQVAEAIELGACRQLKQLHIVSVFTNTCRGNALHMLCAALVKGSTPLLEDLLLGGNGFSDIGTVDIAWLLRVGSLPKLIRLDVRRNFIGESGVRRLMAALNAGRCPELKYLCMGGNIITDYAIAPIVNILEEYKCPQMRFLGLEDNYLSANGVNQIIHAATNGGMMPKLHHVGQL